MHLFFSRQIEHNSCMLNEEESWHCVKVLRLNRGDMVGITDGSGNLYTGSLSQVHQRGCVVDILTTLSEPQDPLRIHIAIAPTKSIDRFEWFLEKVTEIGVSEITPVYCEHSERIALKPERLEKVLVAAMKQSLRSWLPVLNQPVRFREFIGKDKPGQKFIGYCETGDEAELIQRYVPGSDATILIGPEGDFSESEVNLAGEAGFIPVSLGKSRLRTETAGVVACHTFNILNRMARINEK